VKIALAQINPLIGDIAGNIRQIKAVARIASKKQCDLIVYPELAITGYPPRDLVEDKDFVARNLQALEKLADETGEMGLLVGFVDSRSGKRGRPLANAVALLHRGRVAAIRHKTLLPTYDVFDELRHFEPAIDNQPIPFKGHKLGVLICEDMWNVPGFVPAGLYTVDPVKRLAKAGADLFINLSSSPFHQRKSRRRFELARHHALSTRKPFLFVNQTGGNDELVFDGNSLALNGRGDLIAQGKGFAEDLLIIDTTSTCSLEWRDDGDIAEVASALTLGVRDYVRKCGFKQVVLGLSGGIDSAVTAAIAVRALGRENVMGILMPSEFSSRGSVTDAKVLARNLGIRTHLLPITPAFSAYKKTLRPAFKGRKPDVAEENLQARIRGTLLMAFSNKFGSLLLTTGNKSELSMGYCTLYGDMNGGLAVISDVPKTLVYKLGRELNRPVSVIPEASFTKPPSAELRPNQTDQDSLPPYETLDGIIEAYIEEGKEIDAIVQMNYPEPLVRRVLRSIDQSEYKRRQAAPGLRITPKAFGSGRRLPIARGQFR
jgi:NAD+ synthase (glutamine-hydrolysing)